MNTKELILMKALDLFSTYGYDSVSVRDISGAVGIKESSLYNHYKNKQDIFDSIIKEHSGRGAEIFRKMEITGEDKKFEVDRRTIEMYKQMSNEQFKIISAKIFDYYFVDEVNVKLRKMLTIEQYRNSELGGIYRRLSFDDALDFQSRLFAALIEAGGFIKTDPYLLAMAFFAPIFLIFYKFDNDEASLAEARALFERHVDHFNKVYGAGGAGNAYDQSLS